MGDWRDILLSPDATIEQAMDVLDKGGLRTALVVDEKTKLLGIVTDGDLRRSLIGHIPITDPVRTIMNTNPKVARMNDSKDYVISMMESGGHISVPLVDDAGVVRGLEYLHALIKKQRYDNWVVLMAGGLGSRLRPLTDDCPKPLLQIGGKPLLETILQQLIEYGFHKFYISVNYKSEMVKEYFGKGERWGVTIRYLEENKRLGTAGCLSLLPETPDKPLIVMNGDLLTKLNFGHLIETHLDSAAEATMCVRTYEHHVPYGVVELEGERITMLKEKPVQRFFVNAGIYVLDPDVVGHIPKDQFFDITQLFDELSQQNRNVSAFPIHEYWMDIGRMEDFENAHADYEQVFAC